MKNELVKIAWNWKHGLISIEDASKCAVQVYKKHGYSLSLEDAEEVVYDYAKIRK